MTEFTIEYIEEKRDAIYHRTPELRITDTDNALDFVNKVGFCFAFKSNKSELPCLWHAACGARDPEYPHHVQHDPTIGLVWTAKDVLPARKQIYYGKALKNRPAMISLEYLPWFYKTKGYSDDPNAYIAEYMAGRLSANAKAIMDALMENHPMITSDLKIASRLSNPDRRSDFDKAMTELQMKMFVLKIGEFYDPFTFLWDLFNNRFEEIFESISTLSIQDAYFQILKKYFETVLVSDAKSIIRLFRWNTLAVEQTLQKLTDQQVIRYPVTIKGVKSPNYSLFSLT